MEDLACPLLIEVLPKDPELDSESAPANSCQGNSLISCNLEGDNWWMKSRMQMHLYLLNGLT